MPTSTDSRTGPTRAVDPQQVDLGRVDPAQFDHHSDLANADPVAYYEQFRSQCPVGRATAHEGFVYTTRYDDVVRVARDDATFSTERGPTGCPNAVAIVIPGGPGIEQFPLELDPPASREYRALIDPLLTVDAIERIRPMIAKHAERIVGQFAATGTCNFVDDLTNPLPAAVTLDWLGFPEDDWMKLAKPVHDIFACLPGSERAQRGAAGLAYMEQRIRELVADRRAEPRDDVVTTLALATKADGSRFDVEELVSVIGLLIAGGVDTTTSLTGSTLVHLSRHPEDRQRLIDEPELFTTATEEFLRAFAPSQSMARTVLADTTIGDADASIDVTVGDRVLIPWVAGNYDPEVFPDPTDIRLDRDASRHLSFGIGSHRCAGAHLARAMFTEMMTQVLTRIPDFQVDEAGLVGYPTNGNQIGWDSIPATFTPEDTTDAGAGKRRSGVRSQAFVGLDLTVAAVDRVTDAISAIELATADGSLLPDASAGAHLELRLPSGRLRQYSLTENAVGSDRYRIAVQREAAGRGGSIELHELAAPGASVHVRRVRNNFPLVDAPQYVLLAGGIGVTPLLAMARELTADGRDVTMIYGGRSRDVMAFLDPLQQVLGDRLSVVTQDVDGNPDFDAVAAGLADDAVVYTCGPVPMIAAVEAAFARVGRQSQLHIERFTAEGEFDRTMALGEPFEVELRRSGTTLPVPGDQRLIDVIRTVVPDLGYDCERGHCGACETEVIEGQPDHRDSVLTDDERASGRSMMICVGRSCSDRLVLDL